jgi:probable F420-dependent oxidoreductase
MRFGVNLLNRGPLARPDLMVRYAQRAEALGFETLTISDHIVIPKAMPSNYPYHPEGKFSWQSAKDYYEPLTTLGFLAGKTNRIRLGTSVLILPYRNPIETAKNLATLDALTEGRMFLGIGTGWWEDEFKALGLASHFADRGARTDEYVRIYKALWTQEQPAFKGQFHQFDQIEFSPKPHQKGGLPIWVGGHTGRALRRVVELGDVWHPIGLRPPSGLDPRELGNRRRELHALAEKAGRDPASIAIHFRCPLAFAKNTAATQRAPMTGSTAQLLEDINAYQQQGVSHITLDLTRESFAQCLEVLEQVAEHLLGKV